MFINDRSASRVAGDEGSLTLAILPQNSASGPTVPAQRRLAADALPLFLDLHRSLADDVASTSDR